MPKENGAGPRRAELSVLSSEKGDGKSGRITPLKRGLCPSGTQIPRKSQQNSNFRVSRSQSTDPPTSGLATVQESMTASPFVDTYPPRCSQFMLDERFALKATAGLSPNYNPLQNESAIMAAAAKR
jgi:hypothetical protein